MAPWRLLLACMLVCRVAASVQAALGKEQTVTGPIDPAELGPTLVHEHILVDCIGCNRVSPERQEADHQQRPKQAGLAQGR